MYDLSGSIFFDTKLILHGIIKLNFSTCFSAERKMDHWIHICILLMMEMWGWRMTIRLSAPAQWMYTNFLWYTNVPHHSVLQLITQVRAHLQSKYSLKLKMHDVKSGPIDKLIIILMLADNKWLILVPAYCASSYSFAMIKHSINVIIDLVHSNLYLSLLVL